MGFLVLLSTPNEIQTLAVNRKLSRSIKRVGLLSVSNSY